MSKSTQLLASNSCFQWGAVFGGTVIALAISLVLSNFGAAVGLADDAALRGVGSLASWGVIATGIWLLWVQLLAALAGGYTAGYLRTPTPEFQAHENELKDGLYGLIVWAFSTVLMYAAIGIIVATAGFFALEAGTYQDPADMTQVEQNASIIFAFVAGSTALLSGVASWWAGTMGGEHRINGVDFSDCLSFKKK